MRLVKRAFWFALALIFLVEAWLWDLVQPLVQRVVAALPLRRLKALLRWLVARLPAWGALLVMGLPSIVLIPAKLVGLWLFGTGHFILGAALFLTAKSVGLVLVVFLFEICRPKLMDLAWFATVYNGFMRIRAWAHAQTEPARLMLAAWKRRALGEGATFSRKLAALRRKTQRPS